MTITQFGTVRQPASGTIADLLRGALADPRFDTLRAAAAYVTTSGIRELGGSLTSSHLMRRWLTSFDWCRSEPAALTALAASNGSGCRIHAGKEVVKMKSCVPRLSFHPKTFLFTGPTDALVITGSGNVSSNGLRRGIEVGAVVRLTRTASTGGGSGWGAVSDFVQWFDSEWARADNYAAGLAKQYESAFSARPEVSAPLEFGSSTPVGAGRLSPVDLAQIAHSTTLWIEAGNLTASTVPDTAARGHQLMMRPYTRVFFGLPAEVVSPKTGLGDITIEFEGVEHPSRSIEFAHNNMDRLNLPAHAPGYDGRTLRFDKIVKGGQIVYRLKILSPAERVKIENQSTKAGRVFKMSSGRSFGVL